MTGRQQKDGGVFMPLKKTDSEWLHDNEDQIAKVKHELEEQNQPSKKRRKKGSAWHPHYEKAFEGEGHLFENKQKKSVLKLLAMGVLSIAALGGASSFALFFFKEPATPRIKEVVKNPNEILTATIETSQSDSQAAIQDTDSSLVKDENNKEIENNIAKRFDQANQDSALNKEYEENIDKQIQHLDLNNKDDQYYLGVRLANRNTSEQDYKEAIRLLTNAAAAGHKEAKARLAILHYKGRPANYKQALFWGMYSAAEGDMASQKMLGEIFEKGKGVPVDYVTALKWYRMAEAQGDLFSKRKVEELNFIIAKK